MEDRSEKTMDGAAMESASNQDGTSSSAKGEIPLIKIGSPLLKPITFRPTVRSEEIMSRLKAQGNSLHLSTPPMIASEHNELQIEPQSPRGSSVASDSRPRFLGGDYSMVFDDEVTPPEEWIEVQSNVSSPRLPTMREQRRMYIEELARKREDEDRLGPPYDDLFLRTLEAAMKTFNDKSEWTAYHARQAHNKLFPSDAMDPRPSSRYIKRPAQYLAGIAKDTAGAAMWSIGNAAMDFGEAVVEFSEHRKRQGQRRQKQQRNSSSLATDHDLSTNPSSQNSLGGGTAETTAPGPSRGDLTQMEKLQWGNDLLKTALLNAEARQKDAHQREDEAHKRVRRRDNHIGRLENIVDTIHGILGDEGRVEDCHGAGRSLDAIVDALRSYRPFDYHKDEPARRPEPQTRASVSARKRYDIPKNPRETLEEFDKNHDSPAEVEGLSLSAYDFFAPGALGEEEPARLPTEAQYKQTTRKDKGKSLPDGYVRFDYREKQVQKAKDPQPAAPPPYQGSLSASTEAFLSSKAWEDDVPESAGNGRRSPDIITDGLEVTSQHLQKPTL